jgi:hypothetical protein
LDDGQRGGDLYNGGMADDSRYHVRRGGRERIVDVVDGSRPPPRDAVPVRFGAEAVVIEHQGDRVTLVLPGAIRVTGTIEEARRLAAALLRTT